MKRKVTLKKLLTRRQFIAVISVFVAVLLILMQTFYSPNISGQILPVNITIRPGMNYTQISELLYRNKLIPSKINFRIAGILLGASERVRAGRYTITQNYSYLGLVDYLLNGQANRVKKLSFYNGITTKGITERLRVEKIVDKKAFLKFIQSDSIKRKYHLPSSGFEGYLYPDDYLFYEHSSVQEVIDTMLLRFYKQIPDSVHQNLKKSGIKLHHVLTLASIVDGETNRASEMPVIAGVYANRLRIGMKLQADPTLQYVRNDGWGRIKGDILQINSPYNTYKYYGLPPGPINNPGKDALMAAIYPEKHKYLFFVADTNGGHIFSQSFYQHQQYARQYYKWLNNREKMKASKKQ